MGVYRWKDGARINANAELVVEELNSLSERTPECALTYADTHDDAELRKCVTWDDAQAAHQYRLEEMRRVIRSVIIVDESPDREPITYRAFEYVTRPAETEGEKPVKSFMATVDALKDKDFRKQVLGEIKESIGELSRKAKVYRYLAEEELDTAQHHLDLAHNVIPD